MLILFPVRPFSFSFPRPKDWSCWRGFEAKLWDGSETGGQKLLTRPGRQWSAQMQTPSLRNKLLRNQQDECPNGWTPAFPASVCVYACASVQGFPPEVCKKAGVRCVFTYVCGSVRVQRINLPNFTDRYNGCVCVSGRACPRCTEGKFVYKRAGVFVQGFPKYFTERHAAEWACKRLCPQLNKKHSVWAFVQERP